MRLASSCLLRVSHGCRWLVSDHPSLIDHVAAIFETIRKGIVGKINAASSVTKGVFNLAYALKKHVPALAGPADAVVFSKIKDVTGGRLRICMNVRATSSSVCLLLPLADVARRFNKHRACHRVARL